MSSKKSMFYLAKQGKVSGPFTRDEIEKFEVFGKLHDYVWIWSPKTLKWQPIEEPPTFQPGQDQVSVHDYLAQGVLAIFHEEVLEGQLTDQTATGAVLISEDTSALPFLAKSARLRLNWMAEASGQIVDRAARVLQISKIPLGWKYFLAWE